MPEHHRVMVISHGHPDLSPGGGEVVAYNLFRALSERPGVDALFVAREQPRSHHGASLGSHTADGTEILLRTEAEFFRFSQRRRELIYRDFRRLLQWYRPTVVHFHHYVHLGLELIREVRHRFPSVPIVLTLHEFLAICNNNGQMVKTYDGSLCRQASPDACHRCFPQTAPQEFFLRETFIKSFLGLVDAFVSPSDFLTRRYVDWGLPAEKFVRIENGLHGTVDQPSANLGSGTGKRLGFFGQITAFKGLDVLLEAMALLPLDLRDGRDRVTLDVHGSRLAEQGADYQDLIRDRLEKVKDSVTFHGPYTQAELPGLMSAVDWVVIPSVWWENSPVVIQEAFANGVPIICSNIGGMAEKVRDGVDGLHFRVGEARHLADRIREAATSPNLLAKLRQSIPPVPRAPEMADHHLRLYQRLSVERTSRPSLGSAVSAATDAAVGSARG